LSMGAVTVRDCACARVSIYGSAFYFLSQRMRERERGSENEWQREDCLVFEV
jgi:hypothetical protein